VIYVLSFGLGTLLLVGVVSLALVSVADGLFPKSPDRNAAGVKDRTAGRGKAGTKAGSKARRPRANEASDDNEDKPVIPKLK